MSRAAPRRRAERPERRRPERTRRRLAHGAGVAIWVLVVAASAAALLAVLLGDGGRRLAEAGAVVIAAAYAWALAARTGGRPVVVAVLALALGGAVVAVDLDALRSGAAVVVAVLTAVLAVMVTVPVDSFLKAVRETVVAILVAVVGAMATLAWAPVVDLRRFEYAVLGLALAAAFVTVYRLGAGLHGLGSRGVVTVIGGSLLLVLTVGYAELLQRYGTHDLVAALDHAVRWSHHHLGAFPRPIIALLGVPALTWGTHMRSRRRQGWWVCAFGIALTAPIAYCLVDPGRSVREVTLAASYAVVVGWLLGLLLISVDLRLTAPRGARGRRQAQTGQTPPALAEPGRTRSLW